MWEAEAQPVPWDQGIGVVGFPFGDGPAPCRVIRPLWLRDMGTLVGCSWAASWDFWIVASSPKWGPKYGPGGCRLGRGHTTVTAAALCRDQCHISVTPVPHQCHTARIRPQQCHSSATLEEPVPHCGGQATVVPHCRDQATPVPYQCHTSATLQGPGLSPATPTHCSHLRPVPGMSPTWGPPAQASSSRQG